MARMIISADEDGIITAVQGEVTQMTGWTEDELVGEDIEVVIPPKYRERHHSALDNYIATNRKKAMGSWVEVDCLRKDGATMPIMLVVTERKGVLEGILEDR